MATLKQVMPSATVQDAPGLWAPTGLSGVALLASRSIEVRAAWTATQPSFIFPYTSPAEDFDVSRHMSDMRAVEPMYNLYWHRLSFECCARGGLMLDVGSNFGYYALLAAKMGCRVLAWEPVPVFRAFIELAAQLNNVSHMIHVRHAVVSDTAGKEVEISVPTKGIWGTASVSTAWAKNGLNVDPSFASNAYTVRVPTETLDGVVTERACIMKLDVIAGARATLRTLPPAAILAEYTPGVAERHRQWEIMPRYPASLTEASEAGYRIWHLGGSGTKNAIEKCGSCKWSSLPLPGLREVSKGTLRAEAMNAANMAGAQGSFSVPWDLHPRSLHAEFSHNTDVLLTLGTPQGHATIPNLGEVGIFEASEYGLGGGLCRDVLRDGTEQEMVGRLCVLPGRNDSIFAASEAAEARFSDGPRQGKRQGKRRSNARTRDVRTEAKRWKVIGPMRTRLRKLVAADSEEARVWQQEQKSGKGMGWQSKAGQRGRAWRESLARKRAAGKGRGGKGGMAKKRRRAGPAAGS